MAVFSKLPRSAWLVLGILLFATTLRGPFTAVGPLLESLRPVFGLSTSEAGLLITLPLLSFFVVSPFAPLLARKFGLERALFVALLIMCAAIVLRSTGALWSLYAGTSLLGVGIAVGNTLLPSLLKRDFPSQITTLTAVYAITMGVASAAGSAVVVPLAQSLNWQWSLGVFLILPLLSALVWLPQLKAVRKQATTTTAKPIATRSVWTMGLAWQVGLFFGTSSLTYYSVATWLPAMLVDLGYSQAQAGSLHGLMQLATAFPGLILVPIVKRSKDQRGIAVSMASLSLVSLLGLILFPAAATVWVTVFGFGVTGTFILGLSFIGMRAATTAQAAALSGMAQCIGYLLAATGPIVLGALHDSVGNWQVPLYVCTGLCVLQSILGMGAGRAIHLPQDTPAADAAVTAAAE